MLPLIPLAISLVPTIANWIFGSSADKTTQAVVAAATAVTGLIDPDAQMKALQDPAQAAAFRVELAKVAAGAAAEQHASDIADLQAHITDTVSARSQTQTLASGKSPIAYGAPIVSFVVLIMFGLMIWILCTHSLPPDASTLLNIMLGTLTTMATSVVSYWVGSSAGSRGKDEDLRAARNQLANSTPVIGSIL